MRTYLRSKVTLLFIVCAALLAFGGMAMAQTTDTSGSTAAAPTITSDKADYAPGSTVTLTGSGWQPGESVHINVNDTYGATWTRNVDVTADASGNITDSFSLPNSFVSDYDVTATGASGAVAKTTFTDADLAIQGSTAPATQGQTRSFTSAVQGGGNGCQTPVTWSASNATVSPTSAAIGAPVTVTFNNTGTATINVTSPHTSGSGNCSASINVSVAAPADTTPPVITPNVNPPAPNGNGWYKDNVSVSWTVTDAQSPITSKSAACDTTTNINTDTTASGQTVTCSATSAGGTDTKSVTIKLDKTAPNNFQFVGDIGDGDSFPFGSVPDEPTCTADGAVSGLASACQVTGYGTAVGPHTLTATATDNAGNEGTGQISYTVTKATQEITGFDPIADKTYGDDDFNVSAQGGGSGEPVTFTATGDCTVIGDTVHITGAGSCTVTAHQDGNANYDAAQDVSQSFDIAKAPLTVEADNASRKYGEANPTFTGTLTGVKNNDAISASYSSSATAASDIGPYEIVPAIDATASVLANYQTPVLTKGTLTVTKADAIEAKADNASREYGEANPTFTGTLTGVKNNDAISASYSSAATQASDWGTYSIVTSLNDPNGKLGNYEAPVLTNGTLTVTKAPLTIKADDKSRFFGEANPTFTGSIVNAASTVKNNDALSVTASSSATPSSPPGTYDIIPVLNGAKAGNYEVTAQTAR